MRKMEDVGVKGWRKWQLDLQDPVRGKEQTTEEADAKCFHTVIVHLNALVREKRQTRQRRTQRKLEYLESQWHQFASQLSNDGFGMTRHDLGWHVFLFRTGLSCCFPLTFLPVSQVFEEFTCGLLVKSSFIREPCLRPPGGSEEEWTVGGAITSSSLSFCWGSWRRLGCYLLNAPTQRIPRERMWQVDHRWQIKA